jgi:hypothetical protein
MQTQAFDAYKDMEMQSLQDLEEDLTARKESLDSQIALLKEEYQEKKNEEKEGAKDMVGASGSQG